MQGNQPKSRFRGVYRCGKRWKAQLQSQGVQFYLGTFDTEEEAARAYDRKAKEEKGGKSLTNFTDEGDENAAALNRVVPSGALYPDDEEEIDEDTESVSGSGSGTSFNRAKKQRVSMEAIEPRLMIGMDTSLQVRNMWERLVQISQRILLAKAAQEKLSELQRLSPDAQKEGLLRSLTEELLLLSMVKEQLEEAIARALAQGLTASIVGATDGEGQGQAIDEDVVRREGSEIVGGGSGSGAGAGAIDDNSNPSQPAVLVPASASASAPASIHLPAVNAGDKSADCDDDEDGEHVAVDNDGGDGNDDEDKDDANRADEDKEENEEENEENEEAEENEENEEEDKEMISMDEEEEVGDGEAEGEEENSQENE